MKKVTRKVKQALSILLVAAMVITMVPQNTLSVSAEEAVETVTETETVETTVTAETEETVDEETEEDENLEDEEIVEEETEEGIKKGADGFEAMAEVNVSTKVLTDGAATINASGSDEAGKTYIFSVTLTKGYENLDVHVYTDFNDETNTGTECSFQKNGTNGSTTTYIMIAPMQDFTIVANATKITYELTFEITGADVKKTDDKKTEIPAGSVEVGYGESLSFTAVAQEGYKEAVTVTTKSGEDEPVPVTANDGVYTIAPTGDLTVNVSAEALASSRLTFAFAGDAEGKTKATVSEVKIGGEDATITTFNSESVTPYLENIHEDKEVTFKVAQEGVYKFKVESNTDAEGAPEEMTAKDGVYSIKLTEDTTITVTSELDPAQCSVLNITANEKSLADKFTVKVGEDEEPYNATASKNQFLTADKGEKSVVVTPTNKENYIIKSIELDGTALVTEAGKNQTATVTEETGAWTFSVDWSAKRDQAIKVYVAPAGSEAASTVTFKNQTAHMKLEVTEVKDQVTGIGSDKYTVAKGVDFFRFTITADGKYTPTVKGSSLSTVTPVDIEKKDGKTVYTYDVEARKLDEEEEITITEENAKYNVAVVYDTAAIESVEFIQNGVVQTVGSDDDTPASGQSTATLAQVEDGDKVIVTVNAKDGYKLVSASEKVGSAEPKATDLGENTDAYTYELTVGDDTTTTIKTKAIAQAVLNDGEADLATNSKGEYDVAFGDGKAYTAEVRLGGEPVALDDVKVATENATTQAVKNDKKADITLGAEDAGKEVTVVLTVGTGDNAKEYPIKLKLAAVSTEVAVTGVKRGKLTQNVGTVKEYPVTLKPAGAAQTLAAKVDGTGVTAVIENGKLKVTVANTAEAKADLATITIYDTTKAKQEAIKGGEIKVTTTQLLEKVKPTVALKSATDIDLVLTLGSKLNEDEVKALASDAKLYYKVVVTPEDTKNTNLKEAQTVYVERTAATNDETITVFKPEVTQGNGGAANFKVEVTLAQTKAEAHAKDDDFEFATAAVTAKVATKAPYFTTKLGSKKLNGGKAYTGQTDVEVAQITFDKDTTWTNLQVDDADSGLNAEVVGDKLVVGYNNPIIADPGKYDVTVKAVDDGDDNKLHVATTTVKVEIVRGIEELFITAPETLYKKDNKTKASFKADVSYNFGNPDWVPKTKKVTWTVTNTDGKDLSPANAKLITVKNGTVTVDKNYVVSANKAENKFRLNVKAADYKGNTVCAWADFEITSQAAELGDVIIVNGNGHDGWTLVDVTKPVKADELEGAYAVVLKSGIATKSYYTEEGLAAVKADAEVTFKSSNKGIVIDADGMITVAKPAKNVKITVTATDGSKAFKTITLKEVGYTAAEDIGLIINSEYGSWYNLEDKDLSFYGPKDAPFVLMPVLKHSDYGLIPTGYACTDCTVSVKNAKIVAKDVTLGLYGIIATGSPITITLQSKSLNKKVEYKLTNKSIANATANAPKLKTTDKLIGGSYYVPEEPRTQTVTYTLPKEYAGKFIQITSDYNDYYKNDKNELRYNAFEYACDEIGTIVRVNSAGQVTLTFKAVDYYYTNIPAGSYKLNYLVGSYDIDGNFVAETKPGSVTLKAVAQKAVKAKLNTSYTMSLKEGARVGLALNNKNAKLNASNLQNANIKGQENEFTTYFELDGNYLKLKDTLSPEQLEYIISNAAKNDLTGWVTYSYTDGRGDYQGEGEAQIKVSFKDLVQKYSLSKATVLDDAKEVTVNAFTGKDAPANVSYALVTEGDFTVKSIAGNAITLTAKTTPLAKSNKVKMLIVPTNSYYIDEFGGKSGDELNKLIEKYGVGVSTTISAK